MRPRSTTTTPRLPERLHLDWGRGSGGDRDVEDASLRAIWNRGANNSGTDGNMHFGGACSRSFQRWGPRWDRISFPDYRSDQTRHRHIEKTNEQTFCDQSYSANTGR